MFRSMNLAAKNVSMTALKLIRPSPSVTGIISTKTCLIAGSRQSIATRRFPSRPASHGSGSSTWITVPIRIETAYDREVPEDRRERRDREVLVAVQDPDDDPRDAEERDDRKQDPREIDDELLLGAVEAEGRHQPGGKDDEESGQAAEAEQEQPNEARCDAPCPGALPLFEQLAEDRDERRRERSVCDERAHEVRHLERDGEGVDLSFDAEVPPHDDLPDETQNPGKARCEREDRRRPGKPPARASLIHGASIGTVLGR